MFIKPSYDEQEAYWKLILVSSVLNVCFIVWLVIFYFNIRPVDARCIVNGVRMKLSEWLYYDTIFCLCIHIYIYHRLSFWWTCHPFDVICFFFLQENIQTDLVIVMSVLSCQIVPSILLISMLIEINRVPLYLFKPLIKMRDWFHRCISCNRGQTRGVL